MPASLQAGVVEGEGGGSKGRGVNRDDDAVCSEQGGSF